MADVKKTAKLITDRIEALKKFTTEIRKVVDDINSNISSESNKDYISLNIKESSIEIKIATLGIRFEENTNDLWKKSRAKGTKEYLLNKINSYFI